MPWNEPGDQKPRDPWGKNGGNRGNQPPDLDEVFSKLINNMRKAFGGQSGNGGSPGGSSIGVVILLAFLLLGVWAIFDSAHIVQQTERGVVTRFGAYNRTLQPGLQFTLPRPFESMQIVDVTQIQSVSDQGSMLTKDENIVQVEFSVQFRVNNAEHFLFKVRDPVSTLKQASEASLRGAVGDSEMDYILGSGRTELGIVTKTQIQDLINQYELGIEITQFNLKDARPPDAVKAAFDDANKAREDKFTLINEAKAYANSVIPESRGMAARLEEEAEAYKSRVVSLAEGEANRFTLQLNAYEAAPDITRDRLYLETMQQVLSQTQKVVVDGNSNNNLLYLPLDKLGRSGNSTARTPAGRPVSDSLVPRQNSINSNGNGNGIREVNRSANREPKR